MLGDIPLTLPVIEFNGAFISDLRTGRHEIVNAIAPDIAADIYGLLLRNDVAPLVSTFTGIDDRAYYSEIANEGVRWYVDDRISSGDRRWVKLDNLADALRDQVVCFTAIGLREPLNALREIVEQSCGNAVRIHLFESMYAPGWHWLTVHDLHATKDIAISELRERYSLMNRELVVFGDQNNDITMFRIADRAVAVANATEELKACATHVIGAGTSDSVVDFIEADWLSHSASSHVA